MQFMADSPVVEAVEPQSMCMPSYFIDKCFDASAGKSNNAMAQRVLRAQRVRALVT